MKQKAWNQRAKAALCVSLSVSVAALPVPPTLAQSTPGAFMLSDASCTNLLRRTGTLQSPGYGQNLGRNLANTERMKVRVDQTRGTIDRSLLQEMHDQAREYLEGLSDVLQLGAEQLGDEELQRFVRSLNERGIYPEPAKLATLREFENATRELISSVKRLGQTRNLRLTQYVERVDAAMVAYDRAKVAYERFVKDWISDAQLKDYAEVISSLGARALGELGYRLAFMAATANPIAFDRNYLSQNEIARLQESVNGAREQQRKIDSDRSTYETQHQRYCRPSTQQAGARPAPAGGEAGSPSAGQPGFGQPGAGQPGAAPGTATSSTSAPAAPGAGDAVVSSTGQPPAPTPGGSGGGAGVAIAAGLGVAAAVAVAAVVASGLGGSDSSSGTGTGAGGTSTPCSTAVCTRSVFTGNCTCSGSKNTSCTGSTVGSQSGQCPVTGSGGACTNTNGFRLACCPPGTACTNNTCNTLC